MEEQPNMSPLSGDLALDTKLENFPNTVSSLIETETEHSVNPDAQSLLLSHKCASFIYSR